MKKITLITLFILSFSLAAAQQMVIYDHKAPRSLKVALSRVKSAGEKIEKLIYTKDNEWLLATATKRWYSNISYFKNLKGSGNIGLWNRLEADARSGKKLESLGITNRGNWVVLYKDGTLRTSSTKAFTDNGLIPQFNQIRSQSSRAVKVFLGPAGSWVLGDVHARLYSNNLPRGLRLLVESIEKSKLRLTDMAFRLRDNNEFHWTVVAGGNYWKSGAPGSALWSRLEGMNSTKNIVNAVGLQSGDGFTLVSQYKWLPRSTDVLSKIEQEVAGNTLYQRMRYHKVPGVVLAHIRRGRLVEIRPYGYRKKYKHYPMNSFARFPVASLSKAIASAAILKGEEQGLWDLDDSFGDMLKGNSNLTTSRNWYATLNQTQRDWIVEATLKSMLNHTSGLNVHGIGTYSPDGRVPSLEDILYGGNGRAKVFPTTAPGSSYSYSGGAYSLIESMVEQSVGKEFWRFTKDQILSPLNMSQSTMRSLSRAGRINYAEGHENNKGVGYSVCPGKAAGGLFSDAFDYSKFIVMLANLGKQGPGAQDPRYLRESSVRKMMTSAATRSSPMNFCREKRECRVFERCIENKCMRPVLDGSQWHSGLGLKFPARRLDNRLPSFVQHGGVQQGYRHFFRLYNDNKDALLILTNGQCQWEHRNRDGSKEERGACNLTTEIMTSFHRKK